MAPLDSPLRVFNLALRGVMEGGIIAGLAYWGLHTGHSAVGKAVLALGAPLIGFGIWGAVDFRRVGRLAEPLRLAEELIISALAAVAWYASDAPRLAWGLAIVSAVHHGLVYLLGDRLLRTPVVAAPPDQRTVTGTR